MGCHTSLTLSRQTSTATNEKYVGPMSIKIMIVDNHADFRDAVARYLTLPELGCLVVGQAATGAEGLEAVAAKRPNVVLIDISLPDQSGLAVMGRVHEVSPNTAVIIIANQPEDEYRRAAFDAGAAAYLMKQELVIALPAVLDAITKIT
jgi:DNA-binding NarL/FixJ family response regulator